MKGGTGFERVACVPVHFNVRQRGVSCPNETLGQAAGAGEEVYEI